MQRRIANDFLKEIILEVGSYAIRPYVYFVN
jgi:hypothetical protein